MTFHNKRKDDYPEDFDKELLETFAAIEAKQKPSVYVIDPVRSAEFAVAYKNLKRIFGSTNTVWYKQRDELGITGWDMLVTGKYIDINNASDLIDTVLDKADCFEVSAYTNGNVELAITYYGVLKKAGVKES